MPAQAFVAHVDAAFDPDGPLSRAAPHYRPRTGQRVMARAVAQSLAEGGALVVEAGTGVGKTYAYLVPALLSGERVLISTATKTLQDQLFERDLPHVARALSLPVRAALLKGRASYLCLHRLQQARASLPAASAGGTLQTLARIEAWAPVTRRGDLAELPALDERSPVIALVTSTRENCLGARCPQSRDCHVNAARREALAADVVVVNHHLFFADLAVRESGMAELLPTVRLAIFDEAHQLNETGVQFLGRQLSGGQAVELARDALAAGLRLARGLQDWDAFAGALEQAVRAWRLEAGLHPPGTRLGWHGDTPEGLDACTWAASLDGVRTAALALLAALQTVAGLDPELARLAERAQALVQRCALFLAPCADAHVRWLDVGAHLKLVESPLDIAEAMRTRVLRVEAAATAPNGPAKPEPGDAPDAVPGDTSMDTPTAGGSPAPRPASAEGDARAWVFTSATLGDDARMRWFTEPCGLQHARVVRAASPFDYAAQAALYVPRDGLSPQDPGHSDAIAALALSAARRLGGRTMVLTTSLRALRRIGQWLQERDASACPFEVLIQGQQSKRLLIDRFLRAAAPGARGALLVASMSFWEGVDLPGDALQLVVIDKLPFPSPGDPLVAARAQRLTQSGRSPFAEHALPEAAVLLKQGAGRLIRSESDRGLLVIGDPRLLTKGYGRRLLAALPPMRRLPDAAAFEDALKALALPHGKVPATAAAPDAAPTSEAPPLP